jgi:hypothetical protein
MLWFDRPQPADSDDRSPGPSWSTSIAAGLVAIVVGSAIALCWYEEAVRGNDIIHSWLACVLWWFFVVRSRG